MFVGIAFAADAAPGNGDDGHAIGAEATMDFFYAGAPIAEVFQHFQANDERKFIVAQGKFACVSLNDVRLVIGLATGCFARGRVEFDPGVTAAFGEKFPGKNAGPGADLKHILAGRQVIQDKVISSTVQDDLERVLAIFNVYSFKGHDRR